MCLATIHKGMKNSVTKCYHKAASKFFNEVTDVMNSHAKSTNCFVLHNNYYSHCDLDLLRQ